MDKIEKLFDACQRSDLEMVKKLLKKSFFSKPIDINIKDKSGKTLLIIATINKSKEIVELLLEKGADINIKENEENYSALWFVLNSNIDFDFASFLIKNGANINSTDESKNTLLIDAINIKSMDVVNFLLENQADVNLKNEDGYSPILIASFNKDKKLLELLISKGGNINIKENRDNKTALWITLENKRDYEFAKYLISIGADINSVDNYNRTLLIDAVENKRLDLIKFLIENGADLNIKDKFGMTAYNWASSYGYSEICELLKNKGALKDKIPFKYPQVDLNIACLKCKIAMTVACQSVNIEKGVKVQCHNCGAITIVPPTIYDLYNYWPAAKGNSLVSNWTELISLE